MNTPSPPHLTSMKPGCISGHSPSHCQLAVNADQTVTATAHSFSFYEHEIGQLTATSLLGPRKCKPHMQLKMPWNLLLRPTTALNVCPPGGRIQGRVWGRGEPHLLLEGQKEQIPSLAEDPADVQDLLQARDLPTEMANPRPAGDQEPHKHNLLSFSLQ